LVRRWLKAGVVTADGLSRSATGTPQGGVISPLLANVYLHRLDQEMQRAGFRFVRYADDFIVTANRRWKVRLAERLSLKWLLFPRARWRRAMRVGVSGRTATLLFPRTWRSSVSGWSKHPKHSNHRQNSDQLLCFTHVNEHLLFK
jgi:hypothetical protein